jgi:hypothetical protein
MQEQENPGGRARRRGDKAMLEIHIDNLPKSASGGLRRAES